MDFDKIRIKLERLELELLMNYHPFNHNSVYHGPYVIVSAKQNDGSMKYRGACRCCIVGGTRKLEMEGELRTLVKFVHQCNSKLKDAGVISSIPEQSIVDEYGNTFLVHEPVVDECGNTLLDEEDFLRVIQNIHFPQTGEQASSIEKLFMEEQSSKEMAFEKLREAMATMKETMDVGRRCFIRKGRFTAPSIYRASWLLLLSKDEFFGDLINIEGTFREAFCEVLHWFIEMIDKNENPLDVYLTQIDLDT